MPELAGAPGPWQFPTRQCGADLCPPFFYGILVFAVNLTRKGTTMKKLIFLLLLCGTAQANEYDDVVVKSYELELRALHYQCSVKMDPNACQNLRKQLLWMEEVDKGEVNLPGNERT